MIKSLFLVGFVSLFFLSTPVLASKSTDALSENQSASVVCVSGAVRNREAALSNAVNAYTENILDAYGTRQTSLVELYGSSSEKDPKILKKEVKNIWSTFRSSTKNAMKDWRKAKNDVWKAFKAEVKVCKDAANISDTTNASSEL